ncbi:MAG TPA: type II secretion system F family protein [Tepidisphaeraceae bacterium]|jgi:Flp pilus assembly protein TadB|nr:type II secretion system F family protein [Tepidisphaeraceae bacterium]
MLNFLAIIGVAVGLGMVGFFTRTTLIRGQARRRLRAPLSGKVDRAIHARPRPALPPAQSMFRRHRVLPWIFAAVTGAGCFYPLGLKPIFCVTIAVMVGLLLTQAESFLVERKKAIVDRQLADSLDLMIASLRAGGSVVNAIERAADEVKPPLKVELQSSLGLIRYGDEPRSVMRRLLERIPLESFRLFTVPLSVHFEVGGSLAPTLAVVARIVRDRIEIAGRVRSLTAQARASTIALIFVTYGIAFLMWRHDPSGVKAFVSSDVGSGFVAGSMILQAIGIVWQSSMSKIRG